MRYPRKLSCFFVFLYFLFSSCKKNSDTTGPDTPPSLIDSTLLVKSISRSWQIAGNTNTLVESYSYDTINRKLTIEINSSGSGAAEIYPAGTREEISYNTAKLVTHMDFTYPVGSLPDVYYYSSADIEYDAQSVINRLTIRMVNGDIQETTFSKQLTISGYQLTWSFDDGGTVQRRALFDNSGRNLLNSIIYPDASYEIDSLVYDVSGNISKVYTINPDSTFLHYDFKTRQASGDQLYNQRQLIMNGVANIPFTDNDYNSGTIELFGILSLAISNENWQYSKYPYQSATAYNRHTNSYGNLISQYETDGKGRLIKFRLYEEDLTYAPCDFQITYYK